MLKSHERFHSYSGKRLVLVADDELINRELLNAILQDDYDVLLAEDGGEAYRIMREHGDTLSLVLLDLRMPVMSGAQLLKTVKDDPVLKRIPIIVVTADQDAEVESLADGAIDFISKPYPAAAVILARIRRTIELNEDQQIIKYTERDPVTGLYNRDYFFRYAQQLDIYHWEQAMDAVVIDINHFHIINERFGTAYGDELLHRIGDALRKQVSERGGIVCRREADTFLVYCPHMTNQRELLECASVVLERDDGMNVRVRLRMGVYPDVDKSIDIQRRFDRAKMAADTVRNSYTNSIGSYDKTLHDRELYSEQLVDDFRAAIMENQFRVFYQPKFDVRGETPLLTGAEALVRWYHPRLGLVSPGAFIPLFEENGLIQILDECVWRQVAAHIRDWKKPAEAVVQIGNLRFGESESIRIADLGEFVDDGSARVGQTKNLGGLVEGFASRVVNGLADDFHVEIVFYDHDLGVTTRDGETEEREIGHLGVCFIGGEMHQDMRVHVVDFNHGDVQGLCESLCKRGSYEQ